MPDSLSADLNALRIDRGPPSPSGSSGVVRALLILALLGGLAGAGAYAWPLVSARVFKTEVRVDEVRSVSASQASTSVSATGYVIALTVSRVQPRVAGRVARVHVREGESVREGQLLLTLDASDQRAAITAAQARVSAAQARVAVARAAIVEAQVNLQRQRQLVEGGAAPRSGVEDLEARMSSLRASASASEAEVRAAQAEVASLRTNLGQLTLSAPFAGLVMNRPPQVGEIVGLGAVTGTTASNAAAAVIEIMDPASLVVEVDVPEGRLGLVRVGGMCQVSLDAFPDRRLRGAVTELGRRVDRSKGTVPVRVRLDDAAGVLPEMSARVSFLSEAVSAEVLNARARTMLPAAAVTQRGGAQVVFVVEDGVARRREVTLGARAGESVELVQGPSPGARVVLSPPAALSDGSPVKEVTR